MFIKKTAKHQASGLPRSSREAAYGLMALASLREEGWQASLGRAPQDSTGAPLPWLTYPVIQFLDGLDLSDVSMLEFGSGASTQWFSKRVRSILSIEHDALWFQPEGLAPNARMELHACSGDWYRIDPEEAYLKTAIAQGPWEFAVIDGMGRMTCADFATQLVSEQGLVLLDDTEHPAALPGQVSLREQGFLQLDFWGLRPGISKIKCTSLFARDFTPWLRRRK